MSKRSSLCNRSRSEGRLSRLLEELLGEDALALEPRHEAGVEGGGDGGHGDGELGGLLHGPLAGALHAGLVLNHLNERAALGGLVVGLAEDLRLDAGGTEGM